ncbi:LacI family DNA-binding transcriptional regulator [Actinomadura rudentiformis]|uniref:LacI family transcriptional regulator n=1 Tax=Actinomadura rudentiformis TaxID=359158 RepID=A0A6H9YC92_9ACTN|nr:LacI family DNA-binding transcriptional regulator [Actinomadura rudentiformis]KAB2341054.1 LacI family transcriptional regulator [Actinomadura rudentiformis]
MRDVAAAAGVSLKTVSRVVNGEDFVRPDTAERVHSAIARLGFQRNDLARTLRGGGRTRSIGLIIEDVANPFYSQIARGVEDVARAGGRLVISGSSDEDPARELLLIRSLCERRVDGLLIVPSETGDPRLRAELIAGTPAVFLDRPPGPGGPADTEPRNDTVPPNDTVLIDNVGGARTAVEHLLAHGHRRIACLVDLPEIFTARQRHQGYLEALAANGVPADPTLVRTGRHDVRGAGHAMTELLALPDPPTAVFAGNNLLTVGALRAIGAAGTRVALVGFDDFELADLLATPVTVVAHEPADMGRQAAHLLEARIRGDARPPARILLPTRLIVRGSGEIPPSQG